MSRWDRPVMVMVFASTLRSLHMLQVTKLSSLRADSAKTSHEDPKAVAEAKPEDFERGLSFE